VLELPGVVRSEGPDRLGGPVRGPGPPNLRLRGSARQTPLITPPTPSGDKRVERAQTPPLLEKRGGELREGGWNLDVYVSLPLCG